MVKKKINKKQSPSSERHFGVILEDIDSKLDLVVEGVEIVDKKIEDFRKETDKKFSEVDYKFGVVFEGQQVLDKKIEDFKSEVNERFNEVDYKFKIVFEKFDKIDAQFSDVKDELHIIRNELKEKIGRDEFILLEKRVMTLEKSRK